jgi:hypothetical protein
MGQQGVAPAQAPLKSYPLHGNINSADISPDETLVALERTENTNASRFRDIVEAWDFRADKLVARATLSISIHPVKAARFVRFTGDGALLVTYVEPTIKVLRANDLSEVKSITVEGPPSVRRTYHFKKMSAQTITYRSEVGAFELSPTGTLLAMLWTRGFEFYGRMDIYDISSGQQVGTWEIPYRSVSYLHDSGLAWSSNSHTIFLAAPNSVPCMAPGTSPDVFGFDARTGTIKTAITTGLLVGDIAVTPTGQLLAVDSDCVGLLTNHHPKLRVFDLKTNKHARDVRAEKSGVRWTVSVSRNGQRAAAWTSDVRCKFDWLDMACYGTTVSPVFTVWRLPDFSVVARSPAVSTGVSAWNPTGTRGALRISSTGHYLLMYGPRGSVFELP